MGTDESVGDLDPFAWPMGERKEGPMEAVYGGPPKVKPRVTLLKRKHKQPINIWENISFLSHQGNADQNYIEGVREMA